MRALLYTPALLLGVIAIGSLHAGGAWTFALPVILLGVTPLFELLSRRPPRAAGTPRSAPPTPRKSWPYNLVLYLCAPLHLITCVYFLVGVSAEVWRGHALVGALLTLGMMHGLYALNVGHELSHRSHWAERQLANVLVMTSLYFHFQIQHIRGHHARVATPEDPMTAPRGQNFYRFLLRAVIGGHRVAWQLERERLAKRGRGWLTLRNQWLRLLLVQLALVAVIAFTCSPRALGSFVLAAFVGITMMEAVNYIEHYGLQRELAENGRYQRVQAAHSWDSEDPIARLFLFEVSRHSDHHMFGSRSYQRLRDRSEAPRLPTGYFGMIMLTFVPPAWFLVMDPRVQAARARVTIQ